MSNQQIQIDENTINQLQQAGYTINQILLAIEAVNSQNDLSQFNKYLKYAQNNYDELYSIVYPQQKTFKSNQPFQSNNSSNQIKKQNSTKIMTRNSQLPVGLINGGNICYFNSLLQLMLRNPIFVKIIFNYQVQFCNDKFDNFLNSLQKLFANLLLSNSVCYDASEVLQFMFWNQQDLELIGKQQDFRELCELFLQRVDQSLMEKRNSPYQSQPILESDFFFKNQILQKQFLLSDNFQKNILFIPADLNFTSIYNTLFNGFGQQQKELKIPENLFFSISRYSFNRNTQNVVKLTSDFTIHTEIYIDFILKYIPEVNQLFQNFNDSKNYSIESNLDYQQFQKQIDSFQDVIKYYQTIQNHNMIQQLTSDLNLLKIQDSSQFSKKERNYRWLHQQLSQFCFQKYYLHSIVVHLGNANKGHYFIYIYNFSKQKWFSYNDAIVEQVLEDDVLKISKNNGYIVTYISEQQRQAIKQQEEIIDIIQQNNLSYELYETLELQQMIPFNLFQEIYSHNLNLIN
ncbi:unnamed protein product [Paramecium sonneborni]|uniref:Ubiquitin carboxyl-terminal hydrolase n=1 Tax=Paramecium sonneborni TaxID=65129 RepID=A0A8S1MJI1_9CILI|nr:unnamed protein product [Paramecium sonneborni]